MKFRSYVIQLDTLPQDQVMRAEAECFADYARIMKIAEEAAKKVVQIERLTRRLNKALQPPFEHKYRGQFIVSNKRINVILYVT